MSVEILGGLGRKEPAGILLHRAGRRYLLDAGAGLGVDCPFDINALRPDAIFITHDHSDHIGAMAAYGGDAAVYATAATARRLPGRHDVRELPLNGAIDVDGITVTTGRAGHAFGGVWLHFGVGAGLLYTGDFSRESRLFAFDEPPAADLVLADASYGLYDDDLRSGQRQLLDCLAVADRVVLPVPTSGRGIEMILWLIAMGLEDWGPDDALREAFFTFAKDCKGHVSSAVEPEISKACDLLDGINPDAPRILLMSDPDLDGEIDPYEGRRFLFTGHVPPKGKALLKAGQGAALRWNVHPRMRDLRWLAVKTAARRFVPLFTTLGEHDAWQGLVDPAQLVVEPQVEIA